MPHFKLIKTDEILNGPVDYSAPVGETRVFKCDVYVKDYIERRYPVAKKITATPWKNRLLFTKFEFHSGESCEFVNYARGKSGVWYAQSVSF